MTSKPSHQPRSFSAILLCNIGLVGRFPYCASIAASRNLEMSDGLLSLSVVFGVEQIGCGDQPFEPGEPLFDLRLLDHAQLQVGQGSESGGHPGAAICRHAGQRSAGRRLL